MKARKPAPSSLALAKQSTIPICVLLDGVNIIRLIQSWILTATDRAVTQSVPWPLVFYLMTKAHQRSFWILRNQDYRREAGLHQRCWLRTVTRFLTASYAGSRVDDLTLCRKLRGVCLVPTSNPTCYTKRVERTDEVRSRVYYSSSAQVPDIHVTLRVEILLRDSSQCKGGIPAFA